MELLSLMDADHPDTDLLYTDIHSELADHGIRDVIELNSLPVELLATFGSLGLDRAEQLHIYAREKLLKPLGLLETRQGDDDGSIEVLGVDGAGQGDDDGSIEILGAEEGAVEAGAVEGVAAEAATVEGVTVEGAAVEGIAVEGGTERAGSAVSRVASTSGESNETIKVNSRIQRTRRYRKGRKDILRWLDGVNQGESEIEDVEEVDELEGEGDDDDIDEGWCDAELREWARSRHG